MSGDDLIISLKIVSQIKEGQKVCIHNGNLYLEANSRSLWTSIRRWLGGDNRQNTVNYIRNLLNNTMLTKSRRVIEPLRDSLKGLNSLQVTYANDAVVVATLRHMEEKVKEYISEISKSNGKDNSNLQQ